MSQEKVQSEMYGPPGSIVNILLKMFEVRISASLFLSSKFGLRKHLQVAAVCHSWQGNLERRRMKLKADAIIAMLLMSV